MVGNYKIKPGDPTAGCRTPPSIIITRSISSNKETVIQDSPGGFLRLLSRHGCEEAGHSILCSTSQYRPAMVGIITQNVLHISLVVVDSNFLFSGGGDSEPSWAPRGRFPLSLIANVFAHPVPFEMKMPARVISRSQIVVAQHTHIIVIMSSVGSVAILSAGRAKQIPFPTSYLLITRSHVATVEGLP